jgi:hypothetical protein
MTRIKDTYYFQLQTDKYFYSLTTILWLVCLVRSIFQAKLPFISIICAMLFASQIFGFLAHWIGYKNVIYYENHGYYLPFYREIYDDVVSFGFFMSFDLAFWFFAIKYWATSLQMKMMKYRMPLELVNSKITIILRTGCALNILFPILFLVSYSVLDFCF